MIKKICQINNLSVYQVFDKFIVVTSDNRILEVCNFLETAKKVCESFISKNNE